MIYKNKRECCICKHEYIPNSWNAKYCSDKCRKNPELLKQNYDRFYEKFLGYKPKSEVNCIICDKKFIRYSINSKYCKDNKCKLKYLANKAIKKYYKNKKDILEKRKNNINYCIMNKLRMRISCAVKSQGIYKAQKTRILVGCTVEKLKNYLEEGFKKGMSWLNYGKNGWHIDHIKPCASFDLTKQEEQKKCFHYTNLQPLWASDNLSKGSK